MGWFEKYCQKIVNFELIFLYENHLTSYRSSTIFSTSVLKTVYKLFKMARTQSKMSAKCRFMQNKWEFCLLWVEIESFSNFDNIPIEFRYFSEKNYFC